MGLDAADWADIIIPHIGVGVNPASEKVPYEPEAPASGLDWHARTDHRWSCAAQRVTVPSSCAHRSVDQTDACWWKDARLKCSTA